MLAEFVLNAESRYQAPGASASAISLSFPAGSARLQLFFQIVQERLPVLANRPHIENRSSDSESSRAEKIQRRSQFPKISAQNCTDADNQIADQIVCANHLAAPLRFAISDNERLARSVSEFLEAANHERDNKGGKTSRYKQTDWEQRKHDEGHDHERLPAVTIGEVGCGNNAHYGREHLHRGEHAYKDPAHTDIIHGEDHDPGVGNALAKADQDVAQQQPAHRRVEFAQASPKIPPLVRRNFLLRLFAQLALHENGERRKNDRDQERNAHAADYSEAIDQHPAQNWCNHYRQPLGHRLDPDAHRVTAGRECRADERKGRGQRKTRP